STLEVERWTFIHGHTGSSGALLRCTPFVGSFVENLVEPEVGPGIDQPLDKASDKVPDKGRPMRVATRVLANVPWQPLPLLFSCGRPRHRSRLIALLLFCSAALARGAEPATINWTIESPEGVEYDLATRTARITNGVVVRYGDTILSARQATLNDVTGEVN